VGAAIVALAPPVIAIARDKYIVDYGRASDYDLYEALTAPPVERLDRAYALDEIRYSESLRQRMRRVDLDTLTFDFGSWDIDPSQYRNLERIADNINRALENNPDEVFLIEGHTDAVGTEEDNLSLSDRRAQTVAEILTSEFGVPPENLVTQGYGEEYLKVPTERAERANRRIAIRRITPLMANDSRDYE
jgi:outer membrane protein OmpA-like peptidoglycan-associated protein